MPRIVGKIRRMRPVEVDDLKFLRAHTDRQVKITVPGPFTMLQQAQNDFYGSEAEAAMDYAAAVNEEIKDLFAAGADVVQIDEPYMQARPEKARLYGLQALNRALEGVQGTTAVHICFGYAAIIHERPSGYSFLPELAQCSCRQVSIETAQSHLDCSALQALDGKRLMVGCIDLSDPEVETPETVVERIERALPYVEAGERDPRPRLRHEVPAARDGRSASSRRWSRRRRSCAPSTAETAGAHDAVRLHAVRRPGHGGAAPRGPAGAQGLSRRPSPSGWPSPARCSTTPAPWPAACW